MIKRKRIGITVLAGLMACMAVDAAETRTTLRERLAARRGQPQKAQAAQDAPADNLVPGKILNRKYTFKEGNKDQTYALYVPKSHDAKKKTPLIVLLHGLGSNPGQVMRYEGVVQEAEKRGYVVVAPYGYNERGWYGSRGKGKEGFGFGKPDDPDNLGELSEKDVLNILKIVQSQFTIDPDRTFLLGHSMGGGGSLHLAATYPDI